MEAPSPLNLSWITPALAVGGRLPASAIEQLARALHVRYVVDLRVEACDDEQVLGSHGITLLHLPTVDTCAVSEPMLEDGVQWVSRHLDAGKRVYIHCEHGIGRSALLALCILVHRGLPPLEALQLAKQRRPVVSPSPEQLLAFITFVRQWHRRHPEARWAVPGFDTLAAMAYDVRAV